MKIISLHSAAAFLGLGVSALTLAVNAPTLGIYGVTASVLVVLGAVRDYAPRRSYCQPGLNCTTTFIATVTHPESRLAA